MSAQDPPEEAAVREAIAAWRQGHGELSGHIAALGTALDARDGERAREIFSHLRSMILEHLEVEEELAFPLVEKLVAEGAGPVRSLRLAHTSYRRDLSQIALHLMSDHFDAAQALFSAFVDSFETHERLEDRLLEMLG
ncbi:MAG: hemerythrin domain-containing protein [Myxococcota bacterium]